MNIEEQQKQLKKQLHEQISTILAEEKYAKIKCALMITNEETGLLDIISFKTHTVAEAKMMLQEGLDMLNRGQLINALLTKQRRTNDTI